MTRDAAARLRVRVTCAAAPGGMELFTPGGGMRWGRCDFALNAPDGTASDYWIVFGNAQARELGQVARTNTLFIAGEPPAKKIYPRGFYRQFHRVVDTHGGSRHARLQVDAPGLCWLVGLSWRQGRFTIGYDALKRLAPPEKINRVSVICSDTARTPGQRRRLAFLRALRERLGADLAHFGKGVQQVDDKLEAILPYRYHLVLENSQSPHYWTEKLTDAYLGWAFPLYVGCPNLADYFAPESFEALDLEDVEGAVATIRRRLAAPASSQVLTAVARAREAVLDVYNPFARFAHWAERFYTPGPATTLVIRSEKAFRFLRGWLYRWKHRHRPGR